MGVRDLFLLTAGVTCAYFAGAEYAPWAAILVALFFICLWLYLIPPRGVVGHVDLSTAPGTVYDLTHGKTHCVEYGPEDGPLVVLVHGFGGDHGSLSAYGREFAAKGYRALTYDLHGRGYSQATDEIDMNADMFVRQLHELLSNLRLSPQPHHQSFILIGWSMGGAIASTFALKYPDRVSKLILMASAGLPTIKPPIVKVLQVPLLRNLMVLLAENNIIKDVTKSFNAVISNLDDEEDDKLIERLSSQRTMVIQTKRGYFQNNQAYPRSLLNTLLQFNLDGMEEDFKKLGGHHRDVLIIWGDEDSTTPYENGLRMNQLLPRSELVTLVQGTHMFPVWMVEETFGHFMRFLNANKINVDRKVY